MSIKSICENCKKEYKLNESLAGKKAQCSECGGVIQIPANHPSQLSPQEEEGASSKISFSQGGKDAGKADRGNKKTGKFKKVLLVIFGVSFFLVLAFFGTLYYSSISGYSQSDFNIPNDYFQTRYFDKDFDSQLNAYQDFEKLNSGLNGKKTDLFHFYDLNSKCIFSKDDFSKNTSCKKVEEFSFDQQRDELKELRKMKNFVKLKQLQYKNILNKDYIKESFGENIVHTGLIQFFRVSNYVAYNLAQQGKVEEAIDILTKNKELLNFLYKKGDLSLISSQVILSLNSIVLTGAEYVVDNYGLTSQMQEKLQAAYVGDLSYDMMGNALKSEYHRGIPQLEKVINTVRESGIRGQLEYIFLYSHGETLLVSQKIYYDNIEKKGRNEKFEIEKNLNNYLGRTLIGGMNTTYGKQFQKEEDWKESQKAFLEKINQAELIESYDVEKQEIAEKDLGNGFTLDQDDDYSYVKYMGETIHQWEHTSKELPFIWDEGCEALTQEFIKVGNDGKGNWKQEIWENLGEEAQKQCLKENYYNSVSVSKLDSEFYTINKVWYERVKKMLFDTKTKKLTQTQEQLNPQGY